MDLSSQSPLGKISPSLVLNALPVTVQEEKNLVNFGDVNSLARRSSGAVNAGESVKREQNGSINKQCGRGHQSRSLSLLQ